MQLLAYACAFYTVVEILLAMYHRMAKDSRPLKPPTYDHS